MLNLSAKAGLVIQITKRSANANFIIRAFSGSDMGKRLCHRSGIYAAGFTTRPLPESALVHYFSHNIADYRKDTTHLSLLEHGIYRQMLDQYYLDESPMDLDHAKLMRSLCVRNADEMRAFENVLSDFFVRTEDGYIHKRCDVEIEAFHAKSKSTSESAKVRWERVRAEKNANALRTQSESNANSRTQELKNLITQEPVKSKTVPRGTRLAADWVADSEFVLFCQTERPDLDPRFMQDKFRDYWAAVPGAKGLKLDWLGTWRNFIRSERAQARAGPTKPIQHKTAQRAATEEGRRRLFGNDERTIDEQR